MGSTNLKAVVESWIGQILVWALLWYGFSLLGGIIDIETCADLYERGELSYQEYLSCEIKEQANDEQFMWGV